MILDPLDEQRVKSIRTKLSKKFNASLSRAELKKCLPGILVRSTGVIDLTKLNGNSFILNADLIETIESTPDTIISLATGRKYIVLEKSEEVREKCLAYKRKIHTALSP